MTTRRRVMLVLAIAAANVGIASVAWAGDGVKRGVCDSCLTGGGTWANCCPDCIREIETCTCTKDGDCGIT